MSRAPLPFDRRRFVTAAGGVAAGALLGCRTGGKATPAAGPGAAAPPAAAGVSIGYAAITWKDEVEKAIDEIAELGYPGIQLRPNVMERWPDPAALKAHLAAKRLDFVCFSGGGPNGKAEDRDRIVADFVEKARYVQAAGCRYIQATSAGRGRAAPDRATLEGLAETLNAIGRRTAEIGVPLAFHPHMNQIGERPEEVEAILAATDPQLVKLLLDVGHYAAAGGDSAAAIRKHGARLVMMHLKDVTGGLDVGDQAEKAPPYTFVELGQGKVDFKGIFAALAEVRYHGWAVVELDSVPAPRLPREAAAANKAYLESLGIRVG